jgi:hypothetical protein
MEAPLDEFHMEDVIRKEIQHEKACYRSVPFPTRLAVRLTR